MVVSVKFATALVAAHLAFAGAVGFAQATEKTEENTGALSEMTLGSEDAPVTVIEYASLTCTHCADWHEEIFPTINEKYIKPGKIRFILREMPVIPGHPALIARSYAGSMLARCAADRDGADGYFSTMDALFEGQEVWAFGEDPRGELLKIAAKKGIDEASFDACLEREDLKAHIDGNITIATEKFAIQGTPGFIINGAYQRFDKYEDIFEALDKAASASD